MSFGSNLQTLRKQHGLTQEDLADALNVSRQTVSKWEQDICYPETEKIVAICKRYSVSMDQLMFGELDRLDCSEADHEERAPRLSREEQEKYERHMNGFSIAIAAGVALVLLGVAVLLFLQSFKPDLSSENVSSYDTAGVAALLIAVAAAAAVFVWFGIQHEHFLRETDLTAVHFEKDILDRFTRRFAALMTVGVVLILAGVILLICFAEGAEATLVRITSCFMLLIAISVFLFVYGGIQHSKYFPEEKARQSSAPREKLSDAVCGSIMLVATAIYLVLGLVWNLWHPGWVVFPVGGILCGVVSSLLNVRKDEK